VLVAELAAAEIHDRDRRDLDIFSGRRHARQHTIDLDVMGETQQHLVDQAVRADRARNRHQPCIGWQFRNEMVRIEAGEIALTDAAGHNRNVIDVRFRNHRLHCRIDVARHEFIGRVLLP